MRDEWVQSAADSVESVGPGAASAPEAVAPLNGSSAPGASDPLSPPQARCASRMALALCLVFFASGAAALLFETLWFRRAGLMLGNTVWASALVTASFMAGLALGNAVAARHGRRVRRPVLLYAWLELLVAASGVALVVGFPVLTSALAPRLRSVSGPELNAIRLVTAFLLLALPASAMGATLPLLTRALSARDPSFGRVLGRLYGWNTAGAVAGALAGEAFLIEALGVRGTALAGAGLNLLAAGVAAVIGPRFDRPPVVEKAPLPRPWRRRAVRIAAAAFMAGGLLLALETVWFRFLLLFVNGTTLCFAVMLAVVLLGIAAGGLLASVWLARRPQAHRLAGHAALLAGVGVAATYAALPGGLARHGSNLILAEGDVFLLSLRLMLPTSVLSGLLFTLLGKALHEEVSDDARAAGLLTFANTVGAMLGALAGGFLLLPRLGIESSLFLVCVLYGLVAALIPGAALGAGRPVRLAGMFAWGLLAAAAALFPFGLMQRLYLQVVANRWSWEGYRLVQLREGLTETVGMFRQETLGRPLSWRLVTNGISMSGTTPVAGRYMGLFVWWPVALHPQPRTALLISYGLGTTARALVETRSLTSIDVVDVSRDVLDMSALAFPTRGTNPLHDPRVRIRVEDGRFFLLKTPRRYDLITGEPPPPKMAGIGSLYSREYFDMIHAHLAEGGIVTYWLPVGLLESREARSIVKAFCLAFEDCSLWSGYGNEWMLAGTRGAGGAVGEEQFARQWQDPVVGARLRAAGLESPAALGALFLADAPTLNRLAQDDPPLEDDHPGRLSPRAVVLRDDRFYTEMTDVRNARQRFEQSEFVRRMWPRPWRERSREAFADQEFVNRLGLTRYGLAPPPGLPELEALLSRTSLQTAVYWYMGSSAEEQAIAAEAAGRGETAPEAWEILGVGAMARRDYRRAEESFARAEPFAAHSEVLRQWRILALGLAGDTEAAARLLAEAGPLIRRPGTSGASWSFLAGRFALPWPRE